MNTENLTILAEYLEGLPSGYQGFDMGIFCRDNYGEDLAPATHTCGTSMCALGHGPTAGLKVSEADDNCWSRYAERVFGEDWWSEASQFCFGGTWDVYFPDMGHAIRRLRYVAANGSAPENFSYRVENHDQFGEI